jgi:hypothetical protein
LNKLPRRPSAADKAFVGTFTTAWRNHHNFVQMRAQYLPHYLRPVADEWKKKISENSYANIGLVWKLFADVNAVEYVQHLVPTPNAKGRYTAIDPTRFVF